jgi:hypothetical protein
MVGQVKKYTIVFAILALISVVHIYILFHDGYQPPPDKVMRPTNFLKPEEIGAVLARRYWQEVRTEPVVVLGLSPFVQSGRDIWSGFLRTTFALGIKFDRYFILKSLPPLLHNTTEPKFELFSWEVAEAALKNGQRIVVYHLATDAEVKEFVERLGKGLVLLQARLAVNQSGEAFINPACTESDHAKWRASAQLSCNALEISRRYYRKKLSPDKLIATLEKQGPLKQILYVHEPEILAETK